MKKIVKTSILIPTAGIHNKLYKVLNLLLKNTLGSYKIVLAYNGLDPKKFKQEIKKKFKEKIIITESKPRNVSAALNKAVKENNADYYVVMDDDVLIYEKNWLHKAIRILEKYTNIGLLGLCQDKYIDRNKESLGYLDKKKNIKICDYSPTIMCTRKEVMEKCPFDDFFSLGHYDIDWQTTIRANNYLIAYHKIKCRHLVGTSCNKAFLKDKRILKEWLNEKKRISYYLNKHKNTLNKEYVKKQSKNLRTHNKFLFIINWYILYYLGKIKKILSGGT